MFNRNRSTDARQFFWPATCSFCLHLLLVASLAADWQLQPEVVWVSSVLTTEPLQQVETSSTDLSTGIATATKNLEVEEPVQPEKVDEQQSGANESGEPDEPEGLEANFQVTDVPATPPAKVAAKKVKAIVTVAAKESPKDIMLPSLAAPAKAIQPLPMTRFSSASLPPKRQDAIATERIPAPLKQVSAQVRSVASPAKATQKGAVLLPLSPVAPRQVESPPATAKEHHGTPAPPPVTIVQKPADGKPSEAKGRNVLFARATSFIGSPPSQEEESQKKRTAATARELRPSQQMRGSAPTAHSDPEVGSGDKAIDVPKIVQKVPLATALPNVYDVQSARRGTQEGSARGVSPDSQPIQEVAARTPYTVLAPVKPLVKQSEKKNTPTSLRQLQPVLGPRLKGDLELDLTGNEIAANGINVQILFRDYPISRHKKPMTIAENKRVRILIPKSSRSGINTVQTVIEAAPDGIYEFRGAPENARAQEVSCTITMHGTSSKRTVKRLGTRNVGSDSYIMKVLMPEGIIWEDNGSFSGSIEDSDGITKYNSDTGLVWKEYK